MGNEFVALNLSSVYCNIYNNDIYTCIYIYRYMYHMRLMTVVHSGAIKNFNGIQSRCLGIDQSNEII